MPRSDRSKENSWADLDAQGYDNHLNDLSEDSWSQHSGSATSGTSTPTNSSRTKKKLVNRPLGRSGVVGGDSESESGSQQGTGTSHASFGTVNSEGFSDLVGANAGGNNGAGGAVDNAGYAQEEGAVRGEGQWSKGAELHESGTCKPCLFMHNPVGCQNGANCNFCHLRHTRSSKPRPSKGKRDRIKKLAGAAAGSDSLSADAPRYPPPGNFSGGIALGAHFSL